MLPEAAMQPSRLGPCDTKVTRSVEVNILVEERKTQSPHLTTRIEQRKDVA